MLPFLSTSHNMELTLQIESIVRIDSRDGIINVRKDVRVHSIAIHRLQLHIRDNYIVLLLFAERIYFIRINQNLSN